MEGLLCGDDVPSVGTDVLNAPLTGNLDHSFVGLSAGVLVHNLVHADGLADLLGQDSLRNGVGIVEGLHNQSGLLLNGLHHLGVAVAQAVNSDACIEVQVSFAVLIIHIDAFSIICHEIHTLVGFDHVLFDLSFQLSGGQTSVFQSHKKFLPFKNKCKYRDFQACEPSPVFTTAGYSFRLF